ncbi:uncharacterized protein LOC141695230 [Apium graveolens]|uniref:uncharacterized protein LOC141695230 n=1 Tax=Apium graveolens TaxID=4045 RepID=UPI003D79B61D
MRKDFEGFTKKYRPCQLYSSISHRPPTAISSITSSCSFFIWGINLVGPLPRSTEHKKFIIVAIDYHTKWVEAEALARIREIDVIKFFMENIIFRFGVPHVVVTDNDTQFVGKDIEETFNQLTIQHVKASVAVPIMQRSGGDNKQNHSPRLKEKIS